MYWHHHSFGIFKFWVPLLIDSIQDDYHQEGSLLGTPDLASVPSIQVCCQRQPSQEYMGRRQLAEK